MNYAGVKYCPRCGEQARTVQLSSDYILIWCAQCEHTTRVKDVTLDPILTFFEEWAKAKEASE